MQIFILYAGIITGVNNAQSQNHWIQKNATGAINISGNQLTARYSGICFVIGNKAYVGAGTNSALFPNTYAMDFWEYDGLTESWTRKADMPVKRQQTVSFAINGKGYFTTGFDGHNLKRDLWEYNPITDRWTQKVDFPGRERSHACGFSIGTKGYVGTGDDGNSFRDFWEYDPLTDAWIRKADFPADRTFAVGFSIQDNGYMGMGCRTVLGNEPKSDFWKYDRLTDTWTQLADYGGSVSASGIGFGLDFMGYVGTGNNGPDYKNDFWRFDPMVNRWFQEEDLPAIGRLGAVGFGLNGHGYISSGLGENQRELNDLWQYGPDTSSIYDPPQPMACTAFTPNNDGLNDYFGIVGNKDFQLKRLSVFDRSGVLLFHTSDISKKWDGKYMGNPMNSGIYVYLATGTFKGVPLNLKGTFLLIR